MRVIGIDAALRSTGLGVVEQSGGGLQAVEFLVVHNAPELSHSACLLRIRDELAQLLRRVAPDAAAIEGGFFFRNAKTAMILGEARGVAISVCAAAGVPVYEYSPRHAKLALTGYGAASKDQLARMIASVLGLKDQPPGDAADALALAACHILSSSGIESLRPDPI
jgi:crossover junction endodeoxyribonuclease RuvC